VADATDIAATEKAVAKAVEKFGKLDIVFANAGISANTPVGGNVARNVRVRAQTNITAVFFTVQAAAPHLSDGVRLFSTASVISVLGNPATPPMPPARLAYVHGARDGVGTVAARHPGQCRVARRHQHAESGTATAPTPEAVVALEARISKAIPLGRFGKPEQVAKTVLFPRLRRRIQRSRRRDLRRWRCHRISRRRADLSRLGKYREITNPISTLRRKIASKLCCSLHLREVFCHFAPIP
jgi:NAD(P)-dependent dehydrogenase (short-subunit alcohol dehydrogenase family)